MEVCPFFCLSSSCFYLLCLSSQKRGQQVSCLLLILLNRFSFVFSAILFVYLNRVFRLFAVLSFAHILCLFCSLAVCCYLEVYCMHLHASFVPLVVCSRIYIKYLCIVSGCVITVLQNSCTLTMIPVF